MNKEKEFLLTIDQYSVRLTLVKRTGYCLTCQLETEICLVAHRLEEWINEKQYCRVCAINSLNLLENGDYQLANKQETKVSPQEIIQKIREEINSYE